MIAGQSEMSRAPIQLDRLSLMFRLFTLAIFALCSAQAAPKVDKVEPPIRSGMPEDGTDE